MKRIKSLNKEVEASKAELEVVITELMEREEFACTGQVSVGVACGVN